MVIKQGDKYYVKSKSGKNLGGPYDSEKAAHDRLVEVEAFKAMSKKGTKR